nr:SufD family Fe-S cluster assembly protein [Methanotorris igneus]
MILQDRLKELKELAKKAIDKPAAFGEDIDLSKYPTKEDTEYGKISSIKDIDDDYKKSLLNAGIDIEEKERSGSYLQIDNEVIYSKAFDNVEIMPISKALEKYDWLINYYWKAVKVDMDKYTARAELERTDGYFIRVPKGVKVKMPVQACLFIGSENTSQNVHNIIIVEENAELHVITGCATAPHVKSGLHIGISEFYIKKNGKLTFTMIHNWGEKCPC